MKRNDIHRPSVLIPGDYTHLTEFGSINIGDDERIEIGDADYAHLAYADHGANIHGDNNLYKCDVCGAHYNYGSLFEHKDGDMIVVGHDCADKMNLLYDIAAASQLRDRAKFLRLKHADRLRRRCNLRRWIAGEFATTSEDLRFGAKPQAKPTRELRDGLRIARDHHIVKDIRANLIKWSIRRPSLSNSQAAMIIRIAESISKPKVDEKHVAVPVDGERITIAGTVVGLKTVENQYGVTEKLIVKIETEAGSWLVYGTQPTSLYSQLQDEYTSACHAASEAEEHAPEWEGLRGRKVEFVARVVKGDKDEHFGFYSRTSKAKLVPKEVA